MEMTLEQMPMWFILAIPASWMFTLPAYLVIDSIIMLIMLRVLNVRDMFTVYKKSIVKTWLFGFSANITGSLLMMLTQVQLGSYWYNHVTVPVATNPLSDLVAGLYCLASLAVVAVLTYQFTMNIAMKNITIETRYKRYIALVIAAATAPYLYIIPTVGMY